MRALILGGARSGKSRIAEQRALATPGKLPVYIATAWGGEPRDADSEMQRRIARHKSERDGRFRVLEEQLHLAQVLRQNDADNVVFLVDCLTLWLNNCLHHNQLPYEKRALLTLLPELKGDIIFVSNEVGSGIVPMGELNRVFADEAGWLNQAIARLCDNVELVVAGCTLSLQHA
ncbi:MAG TPA: bifunctional adenosylcobinamide kinase/adenosylcobinamide-phosphate guanylyltransferase [Marinagarivorans sp.]